METIKKVVVQYDRQRPMLKAIKVHMRKMNSLHDNYTMETVFVKRRQYSSKAEENSSLRII